jgi:polyisoprenoid-binding protein YceI
MFRMNRILAAGAIGAVLFAGAGSAVFAEAPGPKDVKAGVYKVEPYHTEILFSVSHFGLSNFSGVLSGASGSLKLDPAKPENSKLDVTVDAATVLTPVQKLTDELKDAEWLDAGKFPKASFVSTKVIPTGVNEATIDGELTLHGVTKPVTLKAHFVGAGVNPIDKAYTVGFDGQGVIKRTDFGVTKYAPMIGDEVHLTIHAAFELQQ